MDSRYEGAGWTSDIITLRLNNTQDVTFKLVPDTNMFLGFNFNSGNADIPSVKSPTKILAGESWSCTKGASTNLNTYIYGASNLIEVGDLSLCNSTEYSVATATSLRELKIGDEVHPPIVATKLSLSQGLPYMNLELLDLTNVQFAESIQLNLKLANGENLMPALQTLKLKGSSLEYLTLGEYTPITFLSLPDKIRNINLVNQLVLKDLEIYGTDYVESITLQNCPLLDQISVISHVLNNLTVQISADNLQCDEDHALDMEFMNWLMDINANIKGSIYVESISDELLDVYRNKWSELEVNLKQIYAKEVIFGITGEGGLDE